MDDRNTLRAWRIAERQRLLQARAALPVARRRALGECIGHHLVSSLVLGAGECLGFYWPIKGEFDLREAVLQLCAGGARAALPVVVAKDAALVFRPWSPGMPMTTGVWDIPIPETSEIVVPTVLLVPLVGFDDAGYRLGYGGGFYDRTLAACLPRPLSIGIGLSDSRLSTIHPAAHDIPLDAILTETGWARALPNTAPHRRSP